MNGFTQASTGRVADGADLHAIASLQRRFAELNDAARWQEACALFLDDARFTRPSDPDRPILGRAALLQSFLARPAGATRRHWVSQPDVRLLGDGDSAWACCHTLLLTDEGGAQGKFSLGGFHDELRRTPEGWRFASRTGFSLVGATAFELPAQGLAAALDVCRSLFDSHHFP